MLKRLDETEMTPPVPSASYKCVNMLTDNDINDNDIKFQVVKDQSHVTANICDTHQILKYKKVKYHSYESESYNYLTKKNFSLSM